ncbi:MAG TPA: glycoside hydrolase family 127 protein [Gemmataceae bacterium]
MADTSASPHIVMRSVGLADVTWSKGFWADRFETCRKDMIPHLSRIMEGTEHSQFLHNFRIAAGTADGRHRGPSFNDGDCYKWLEAMAAVSAVKPDKELDRLLDEAIRVLAKAQRADGYLHTPVLIKNRNGGAAKPFQDPLQFEMYNLGHLLTAACVHHRATGKRDFLDIAIKAADFLHAAFKKPSPQLARNAICPSHYMGLVELYRTTRETKYLRLAEALVNGRDRVEGGSDDNQDRIPFRKQTQAVGHAVRANYLYAGIADLYAETGDETLLMPLRKIWDNVVSRKMYITGGCGALYDGASPDGARDQKQIARTHQAYGRDYQLPNSTAHNETCAAVGNALWNWRMLQITGDARCADVLELVLYNAALAGTSLDGTRFFYTNTLRQLERMPAELRWSRTRQPFISSFCCPPNLARTLAEINNYAYGQSDNSIWVNLYGGGVLDTTLATGERVALAQETDYPWHGRVRITIRAAPAQALTLRLRVPGWVDGASLSVNGTPRRESLEPGRYAAVKRIWMAGDVVDLDLPLRPRLIQAHPLVEEVRNQIAVQRGPIVYCLESADLEKGVAVSEVLIPRGIDLRPRHDRTLLGGVTVLEGKAEAIVEQTWSGGLYRELAPASPRSISLRLIPYYAWGNRGPSEMTVWIPLER